MARKTVILLPGTQHALEKVGANIKKATRRLYAYYKQLNRMIAA